MKRTMLISIAIVSALPALAQAYEKNNMPCAELCIGDGLAELRNIHWDRAKSLASWGGKTNYAGTHPLTDPDLQDLKQAYRGAIEKAGPYLIISAFDRKALPLLESITVACTRRKLRGTFTTQNGNPTEVEIALVPDGKDVKIQRWTVVSIRRNFPAAVSDKQRTEIEQQLKARYERFSRFDRSLRGAFEMNSHWYTNPAGFGFGLSLLPEVNEFERYKLHPACGGANRISID